MVFVFQEYPKLQKLKSFKCYLFYFCLLSMNRLKLNVFHLLSLVLLLALVLPVLVQDGMFMDGVQYACVSKNLAHGVGTFWFPWLNESWIRSDSRFFMEHPPLVYGIQAVFFKVFGDSLYTERIYGLFVTVISALLIVRIWRKVYPEQKTNVSWMPVVLWIIAPVCFWSLQNNVQENTMGVFTLLSVLLMIVGSQTSGIKMVVYFLVAGIIIFAAFMCKGVPGLFPLGVIGLYYLATRKISFLKALGFSAIVLVGLLGFVLILILMNKTAAESLEFYIYERLLQRVNEEPTVETRWFIIGQLCMELLPMLLVGILLYVVTKNKQVSTDDKKNALFFILIGLSASLPLLLTGVQRGFYLFPCFPFFALGITCFLRSQLEGLTLKVIQNRRINKVLSICGSILLITVIVISFSLAGKPGRDKEVLYDVHAIGNVVPENSLVICSNELYNSWNLHFYLSRYYGISLEPAEKNQKYQLIEKSAGMESKSGWELVDVKLLQYNLLKRKD